MVRNNDLGLVIAKYQTEFPDHALTEMEKNPAQVKFWENWAAAGDRRLAVVDALQKLVEAEDAWRDCRYKANMRGGPGIECGCGGERHYKLYMRARAERDKAKAEVDKAVTKFKRGK